MIALFTLFISLFSFASGRIFFMMEVAAIIPQETISKVGEVKCEGPAEGSSFVITIPETQNEIADRLKSEVFQANGRKMVAFELPTSQTGEPQIKLEGNKLFIAGERLSPPSGYEFKVNPDQDVAIRRTSRLKADIDLDGSGSDIVSFGLLKGTKPAAESSFSGPMGPKRGIFVGGRWTMKWGGAQKSKDSMR